MLLCVCKWFFFKWSGYRNWMGYSSCEKWQFISISQLLFVYKMEFQQSSLEFLWSTFFSCVFKTGNWAIPNILDFIIVTLRVRCWYETPLLHEICIQCLFQHMNHNFCLQSTRKTILAASSHIITFLLLSMYLYIAEKDQTDLHTKQYFRMLAEFNNRSCCIETAHFRLLNYFVLFEKNK